MKFSRRKKNLEQNLLQNINNRITVYNKNNENKLSDNLEKEIKIKIWYSKTRNI